MDGQIKNITELILALEKLKKGEILDKDSDLRKICEETFKRLQISKYFKADDVPGILIILRNLPDSIKTEEIGKINYDAEKLDPKSLNKQDLEGLIKDYEEAKDESVRKVFENEIYKRTGKEDINLFIKVQKEIAERNKKVLEVIEKIDPKLKGEIETKLEKIEQGMEEVKAKKIEEIVLEEKEFSNQELEKEIKKIVKEKEKTKEIFREVVKERAEIKAVKKADELAVKVCEELKNNQVFVKEETRVVLREKILEAWKNGEHLKIPPELIKNDEYIVKAKLETAVESFKKDNLETIVNYRNEELGKEISYKLRESGVKDEILIKNFVEVNQKLNYQSVIMEVNKEEVITFVERTRQEGEIFKVQPENAADEARWIMENTTKRPQEFKKLLEDYRFFSDKVKTTIGRDKVEKLNKIFGVKEVRLTEKMAHLFKDTKLMGWMNKAQRMVGLINNVGNFPAQLMTRFGFQDVGMRLGMKALEKIGGQAAVKFVTNAAAVIAKEGTIQGIKTIALSMAGKGAVMVGGTAIGGTIAAIAAIPGLGWIISGAMIVLEGIKAIGRAMGRWARNTLNINPDAVGDFFENTLGWGKVGRFVGGAVTKIGGFFVGIPAMLGTAGMMITVVILAVFMFIFGATMSNQGLVSSLVPPAEMGNCVLKSEFMGNVNCNQGAPENDVPGLKKDNFIRIANSWSNGTNFASACYNDVVNRSLCAGINPAYSLWMWLNESGASNYNRNDIEDFGIHFIPENKNFNAQITKFLTLNPASGCIDDPRIGGNYWLALGANFMNGSDCNPDRPNSIFKSATPRKWLADFQTYWWEITSEGIPNTIFVPKAGQNCGEDSSTSNSYVGNAIERTDENGNVWICTETTQATAGGVVVDPNAPGLSGVIVDGECSVGEVVVPTKQCDSKWGQTQLNGGNCENGKPGTICSAGCGPTSVSMLMRHSNGSLTPNNVIFGSGSSYINMGCEGSSFSQAQSELSKKFGSGAVTYDSTTIGCDEKAIAKWVCSGKVVMVLANFYRNTSLNLGGHYVLAVGVKDGKIVVRDPFYEATETPFDGTKAYGYAHDIKGCLLIDKAAVK